MLTNVTQNFKLQRPDLESCRAGAVLRLFIAELCSTAAVHKLFGCGPNSGPYQCLRAGLFCALKIQNKNPHA